MSHTSSNMRKENKASLAPYAIIGAPPRYPGAYGTYTRTAEEERAAEKRFVEMTQHIRGNMAQLRQAECTTKAMVRFQDLLVPFTDTTIQHTHPAGTYIVHPKGTGFRRSTRHTQTQHAVASHTHPTPFQRTFSNTSSKLPPQYVEVESTVTEPKFTYSQTDFPALPSQTQQQPTTTGKPKEEPARFQKKKRDRRALRLQ